MIENTEEPVNTKRLALFIGVSVLVIAIITFTVMYFMNNNTESNNEPVDEVVTIDLNDRIDTETVVEEFMQGAGNFGFKDEALKPENIGEVEYLVSHSPNDAKTYFTSRNEAYGTIRDKMFTGGAVYYNNNVTGKWTNEFETQNSSSFKLESATVKTREKGSYLNIGGEETLSAYADVTFSSTETITLKTADDSSWDGTFDVLKKGYSDNTMRVTLVKIPEDGWKIYAISDLKNEFLLASWKSPSVTAFSELRQNFEKTGSIQSTIVQNAIEDGLVNEEQNNE